VCRFPSFLRWHLLRPDRSGPKRARPLPPLQRPEPSPAAPVKPRAQAQLGPRSPVSVDYLESLCATSLLSPVMPVSQEMESTADRGFAMQNPDRCCFSGPSPTWPLYGAIFHSIRIVSENRLVKTRHFISPA